MVQPGLFHQIGLGFAAQLRADLDRQSTHRTALTIRGCGIVCASGSPYPPVIESPQQEMPCRISTHPLDNS
ncbi:hypothetical protein BH24ACT11_BH24ACT11_14380 [soil metagenome]